MDNSVSLIDNIYVFDNFLSQSEIKKANEIIKTKNWCWGHESNGTERYETPFWSTTLMDEDFFTKEIKETEADGTANIVFSPSNTDIVDVYLPDGDSFRVKAYQGYVPISFAKNFKGVYGLKKVILVPFNDAYGSGDRYEVLVNFVAINEFPNITQILFPTEVEVPSFSDGNLSWSVSYFTNNVSSVDVDLLLKDNSRITLYKSLPQNSAFNVNIKDLATKFPLWNGSQNLTLILKPFNRSGEKELVGNEYQISTNIIYPSIKLDEDIIRKSIYDAFIDNFDFIEPEKESKYLTHIINLGNDDRVLISSWEEDNWTLSDKGQDELGNTIVTKEVKSLILKLYEPLPADVQVNSTLWITKLMTNPLVETIIINEQYEEETPFIRGPNFNIEVDFVKGMSTDYESLDDLIISSSSSTQLIQTYLSGSNISMYDLNIQYVKESNTISPPSNFQATILYNAPAGAFFANGYEHNYRIYSYIDTGNGNRIYSHAYSTLQTNLADNNLGDNYEIYAFWDKVDGADGYRVLKYDTFDSNNYTAGYDTQLTHFYERNVTGGIDEAGFDGRVEYYNVQSADIAGAYAWENFVHFSSAEDRIKNFIYKVQLIEDYDLGIATAASSSGCIVGTGEWTGSITAQQEVERLTAKKYSLIQGFDGFETFLYTYNSEYSSDTKYSLTWPFSGTTRLQSTSQTVSDWYNTIIEWANYYDNTNPNNLINNLPQYILTNPENENYILFFAMIGQHFDTIYFYTKAIENSRNLTYSSTGIADKLLFDKLKSMSWEALNLGVDTKLWEYIYGEDSDGNVTQTNPAKKRTNEIWRRIINNLPYLLKHKGTRRGIHALMSCYGIPSSNLSIMEFGGPEKTDEAKGKLLVDNFSYAYGMKSGDSIIVTTPNVKTIEFFVKPAYAGNFTLASAGSNLVISGSVNSSYGKVKFGTIETPSLPLFNGRFFGISVTNWGSYRQLDIIQTEGERLIFSASVTGNSTLASSNLTIGTTFTGSIDEFRVWNQPLSQSVFLQHVYYPEMINGNHISASTTDLEVRLDFEYPKDLKTKNKLLNVCPSINLGSHNRNYYEDNNTTTGMTGRTMLSAAAVVNNSYTDYPYGFEVINRDGVLQIPSLGSSRYSTNKVRIEEQYLISDLSPKYRSTIKAFDNAPTDSNRVGLFVSPNKELNLDIAKSLGSDNLDDYIGDPSDRYKSNYKSLDGLRNYYFGRVHNRNVYEYIDVIKNYEKAMFEDLKKMLPARVKATTGLLIEPHFLERSKYEYTKPSGSNEYYEGVTEYQSEIKSYNEQFETVIDANLGEKLLGENEQYESIIDANLSENIFGENEQYSTTIFANDDINLSGESENYETTINAKFDLPTKTKQLDLENNNLLTANTIYQDIGFSVYAQNGNAIWNYYDTDGSLKKERVSINLVTEQKLKTFDRYNVVNGGVGDPRGGFTTTSSLYTETTITIQEWTSSTAPPTPQIGGNIINVQPVDGYLPIHYKYVGDLTTGLQNSFFKGCKNTSDTTLDGTAPIEVFVTNPNTIKVIGNETSGRDVNEPIIQVD